ncbi:30S ribosomal protein S17 [Candidatus Saccharibacteria bacterium]|nr:30S ribosomal protein S17 [Candidatus Saccharibacteria bacterium]
MNATLRGTVTSDKRDKTITVSVLERKTHPLYRKQYTVTRKYSVHDPKNEAQMGDVVEIGDCRPVSKTKTWALKQVISRGPGMIELKDEVVASTEKVDKAEKTDEAEAEDAK